MKKIYLMFLGALAFSGLSAQELVSGCNDPAGGIQIIFDEALACNPGTLAGMAEIGFHSGANMWANVVDWNAAGAVTASNNGNDDFTVYLADPSAYYGVSSITDISFVFNQGPTDAANPWANEGKRNDNGNCVDLSIQMSSITETCAVTASTRDLLLDVDFQVMGNPFTDRAQILFDNTDGSVYTARLADATGRILRTYTQVNTNQLTIERENLSSGFYFLTMTNEEGKFATLKLFAQ